MTRRALIPLFLLCAAAAAAPAQTGGTSAVLAVIDSQAAAWNRGDLRGYMEGCWKSDSLVFTSGGRVRRGWQATLDAYAASYGSRDLMGRLAFSDMEIHLLTPESAWVLGRWRLTRTSDAPGGVFSLVLKKFGGGWKIVHDHTSADAPARKDSSQ